MLFKDNTRLNKKSKFLIICLIIFAVFFIIFSDMVQSQLNEYLEQDLSPIDDSQVTKNPKIEDRLLKLINIYLDKGEVEAIKIAKKMKIDVKENRIRLVVETCSFVQENNPFYKSNKNNQEIVNSIIKHQLKNRGGEIEIEFRNLVQSMFPISNLQELMDVPEVNYIRLPLKPYLCATSEGVNRTNAKTIQNLPDFHSGKKVKVCILDLGFNGYKGLLGSDLPSSVKTKSFRADGKLDKGLTKHGTACAEIVHDMAPDAELYLVNFNTYLEHREAVNWIINKDVDIISYSIGWVLAGAGDGTGPICEEVEKASNNGIKWVNAAGNEALDHWEGTFNDPDGDNWHNFQGNDEILEFYVSADNSVGVNLNWDDWGIWNNFIYNGSDQDYDLYLYRKQGNSWVFIDKSTNQQNGAQWPIEYLDNYSTSVSTYWGVAIKRYNATKNVKLELTTNGCNSLPVEYNVPFGSVTIPADSPYAIAVGASSWTNDNYHLYSSRGPTSDFRIKPDFSAPSGVSSETYGNKSFFGTSASTPHVAGALALLKGKTPFTLDQIENILKARAVDLGLTGKDNKFGYGRIELMD